MADNTTRNPWGSFDEGGKSETDEWLSPRSNDCEEADGSGLPGQSIRYFGDYEIHEEIGRGGMGIVYRAVQKSLNRTVALKMIGSTVFGSNDERAVSRFRREAEAAANLIHSNIATVYEVGEYEGQHYYTMEYIDGMDLGRLVKLSHASKREEWAGDKNSPPTEPIIDLSSASPKEIATLMSKVARAIHFAHREGVFHRDIKPQNILIDRDGEPHVVDFGLAKMADEAQSTRTGGIIGTVQFMPPEQAEPCDGVVGPQSDVYSLGATLYTMLTGKPPMDGSAVDVLAQIKTKEPKRLRTLNPAIPRDLEWVCHKCLEKNPQQRYTTANELAEDLDRFIRDLPVVARPVTRADRAWRWCKRNPLPATLAASVAVVLAIGAIVSSAFAIQASLAQGRLSDLNQSIASLESRQAELLEREGNLRNSVTALRSTKIRLEKEKVELAESVNALKTEKDVLHFQYRQSEQANDILRTQSRELRRNSALGEFDGEIVRADYKTKSAWINLGSADGVQLGLTFRVYDPADLSPTKGRVEVTRVTGDHSAEVRILSDDVTDPPAKGDIVDSFIWVAGGRRVHFALAGFMDIDGDGGNDKNLLNELIIEQGGIVDAELRDDGNLMGRLSFDTKYLVLGECMSNATARQRAGFQDVVNKARDLGVESISPTTLLELVGANELLASPHRTQDSLHQDKFGPSKRPRPPTRSTSAQ